MVPGIGNLLRPGASNRPPPKNEPKPEPIEAAPVPSPTPTATQPAPAPIAAGPAAPLASPVGEATAPRPVRGPLAIAEFAPAAPGTQALINAYRRERTPDAAPDAWISRAEPVAAAVQAPAPAAGTRAEIIARAAYSLVVDAGATDPRRTLIDAG